MGAMSPRRRRHDRRSRAPDHPEPARTPPQRKVELRRRADFEARAARIKRVRTFVGLLGFIPLAVSLFCGAGGDGLCAVPREIYLAVWAAIFGTFLGLTIRLWRERRAFEKAAAPAANGGAQRLRRNDGASADEKTS